MNEESLMTYNDGVRLAARVIALISLISAVTTALYFPAEILSFARSVRIEMMHQNASTTIYFLEWGTFFLMLLLRIGILLAIAIWFYRCGPMVQKIVGRISGAISPENRS
jgi:hypothetical protein